MMREDWVEIRFDELISNVSTSNNKVKQREYLQKGLYPVIDQGQELIGGYIDDEEKIVECNLPVIVFGDHTKIVKYINFKFVPGADGTKILEPKRMVEPKYLYYVTKFVAKKIEDRGYARHYQYLRKESVFVAPAPEQRAIVAKIEELFSELDSGIDSLNKAKKQLEVYRQAVLKVAFEGELTKAEVKIEIKQLGDECEIVSGKTPKGLNKVNNTGEYQFYKVSDMNLLGNEVFMKNSKLKLNNNEIVDLKIKNFPAGTVIFPKRGGAIFTNKKRILSRDSSFDLNLMGVIPNKNYQSRYIYYFFIYQDLRKICDGSAVPQINNKHIIPLKFPSCSLKEQEEIIKEIESRLSVCENIEANIDEALKKAEALRHSILKKAFEGKLLSKEELEVCKQEDDWEAAEKLLKRIKEANKEVK